MNLSNLKPGMICKNYKELCFTLDIDVKTGKSKILQLEDLLRYCDLEKQGQKLLIKDVYEIPIEKEDMRKMGNNNIPYIKYIEILILDLLVQSIDKGKDEVFLSKNKLFKELKMINDNYAFCKTRTLKLSKVMSIEKETIEEWYLSTDGTLKRNLEKALDNLKKQFLVLWTSEITICEVKICQNNINKNTYLDSYDEEITTYQVDAGFMLNHREATKEEKKIITHTEREIMLDMGYESEQEIVRYGAWDKFKERVNEIILKKLNISYYYDSYKILFNEDHIQNQYEKLTNQLLLDQEEKEMNQNELNTAIVDRLKCNGKKRQDRALCSFEYLFGDSSKKIDRRTQENYIADNNKLINVLIDKNGKSIKNKIKRTKIS